MLEDRSQGDRRPATHLLGLVAAAKDGEQRVTQLVVDDREVTCQLSGQKEVGLGGLVIPKEVEQHLPGTFGPVPSWSLLQGPQVHLDPSHTSPSICFCYRCRKTVAPTRAQTASQARRRRFDPGPPLSLLSGRRRGAWDTPDPRPVAGLPFWWPNAPGQTGLPAPARRPTRRVGTRTHRGRLHDRAARHVRAAGRPPLPPHRPRPPRRGPPVSL